MLEIPLWMLDAVACATMRYAPDPVADLRALAALKVLLEDASARATSPEDIQGLTVASPDRNRGDRHGTQTPPLSDQTPALSVRSLRGGAADRACPDAELEHIAGGDAAQTDRPDGSPVRRSRRRPSRRVSGERQ